MTTQECYAKMGANYEEVLGRLYNEAMIHKFVLLFLKDDSYSNLEAALKAGDVQTAFRAAHTLKGLAANLGLVQLGQAASALTEALRGSDMQRASALYPETAAAYRQACAAIGDLDTDA